MIVSKPSLSDDKYLSSMVGDPIKKLIPNAGCPRCGDSEVYIIDFTSLDARGRQTKGSYVGCDGCEWASPIMTFK